MLSLSTTDSMPAYATAFATVIFKMTGYCAAVPSMTADATSAYANGFGSVIKWLWLGDYSPAFLSPIRALH